jgi:hypothetical protein
MFLWDHNTIGLSLCSVREVFVSDTTRSTLECRANKKSYERMSRTAWFIRRDDRREARQR